jgi:thioredoxin reductase (NADPH)
VEAGGVLQYDCVIVGGGIAGLQAAIQLGRSKRSVVVIDSGYGRSNLCRSYHNLLGWPDGISGEELRRLGRLHAERYGVQFVDDEVIQAEKKGSVFELKLHKASSSLYICRTLLLATGVLDRFPPLPGLIPCLGLSVYVCPDCDGYEVRQRKTIVMGSGEVGAAMAQSLLEYTKDLIYINHELQPVASETLRQLAENGIFYSENAIELIKTSGDGCFEGVQLMNGQFVAGERGFIAFGGNKVRTQLAEQLGIERLENKHIITDSRNKMTSVTHVWAAGDAGVHAEQVSIAMGEGSLAAIWINKTLVKGE